MVCTTSAPVMGPSFIKCRWTAPASFASATSATWRSFYMRCIFFVALVAMVSPATAFECFKEGEFDSMVDYFPTKTDIKHSSLWNISYHGHYKVVTNKHVSETYVLTLCGAPQPDTKWTPEGAKFFEIPIKSVALTETIGATTMELLGLRSTIAYIDTTYLTSPCLNAMKTSQLLDDLEWDATKRQVQLDKVDMVMAGNTAYDSKKAISFSASADPGSLARAEWIKFLAPFFNLEAQANELFDESVTRYQCHTAMANAEKMKPKVAWITHSSYMSPPFMIQYTPYKEEYTRDAGGLSLVSEEQKFETAAELVAALQEADVVIDENYNAYDIESVAALYGITEDELKTKWTWVRHDRLIKQAGPYYGSDWLESAMPEPDVVLEDFIEVFHPTLLQHDRHWVRRVEEPRIENDKVKCDNVNSPLQLKHNGCPAKGSCKGSCGVQEPMTLCYCDHLCEAAGDCCPDYKEHCLLQFGSCEGHCGNQVDVEPSCFCDVHCDDYGDCCNDFHEKCQVLSQKITSCEGHCEELEGLQTSSGIGKCYCDFSCIAYSDCCSDYEEKCG